MKEKETKSNTITLYRIVDIINHKIYDELYASEKDANVAKYYKEQKEADEVLRIEPVQHDTTVKGIYRYEEEEGHIAKVFCTYYEYLHLKLCYSFDGLTDDEYKIYEEYAKQTKRK